MSYTRNNCGQSAGATRQIFCLALTNGDGIVKQNNSNKISIEVDRRQLIHALEGNAYNRSIFQKVSTGPDKSIHTDTITVDSTTGKTVLTVEVRVEKPETEKPPENESNDSLSQ